MEVDVEAVVLVMGVHMEAVVVDLEVLVLGLEVLVVVMEVPVVVMKVLTMDSQALVVDLEVLVVTMKVNMAVLEVQGVDYVDHGEVIAAYNLAGLETIFFFLDFNEFTFQFVKAMFTDSIIYFIKEKT